MTVQTAKEMKDAATDSRSLSAERNFQNMLSASQVDIPAPQSILPVAILERPSLEVSELSDKVAHQQQQHHGVDHLDIHRPTRSARMQQKLDANRKVAFRDQ